MLAGSADVFRAQKTDRDPIQPINCNCACLEFIRRGARSVGKKAAEGEVSSSHIRHEALGAGEEVKMSLSQRKGPVR